MEIDQLRTFVAVSDAGSLTKAAEKIFLTQPAISRQIQALEASLGLVLFERIGRGVRLTDDGMLLRGYAERCLALLEDCRRELEERRDGTAGRLRLGVGGTHPMSELPEWLQSFSRRFPGVEVSVRTGRSQEMIAAIRDRQLDLAFVRVPVTDPRICVVDRYEERIILVAQPDKYPAESPLDPAEVSSSPLILFPQGSSFRAQIDAALAAANITPRICMETDSIDEIRRFVAMGMGVAFLPASSVREDIAAERLVEVHATGLPELTRHTTLIYLRDRYQSAAMREFIKLVTMAGG